MDFNSLILLLGSPTAGLGKLSTNMISNWVGPLFLFIVAAFAIKFLISRQFRELAGFLGIAAIVALLVFNASGLFGQGGIFYKIADSFSGTLDGGGSTKGANGGQIINFLKYMRI